MDSFLNLKRRLRKEMLFKCWCILSVTLCTIILAVLFSFAIKGSYNAFFATKILIDVKKPLDNNYNAAINNSLTLLLKKTNASQREINSILSRSSYKEAHDFFKQNPGLTYTSIWVDARSKFDLLYRGLSNDEDSKAYREIINVLSNEHRIKKAFNSGLFLNSNSQRAEDAGIFGAVKGSLFVVLVFFAVCVPISIATAVYLEEFTNSNGKLHSLIEVNINNLAAVPSIIYGLLGLSLYIHFFGLPRSSSLVGGLTLSLLTLPIMIVSVRSALRDVPKSIRDVSRTMGATDIQTVFRAVLPAATPGIITGILLAIARVVGETAPLFIIGMAAFLSSSPHSIADPATTLPVQIYLWSSNPGPEFFYKSSAAILVLILFMLTINIIASLIRRRFEIRW